MSGTFITNLPCESNPNLFYRIKVECSSKSFALTIIDDKTAYKGEITTKCIAEQSGILNISEDEYIIECRNALKNSSETSLFSFSLKDEQFFIKKRLKPSSSIKVKFGIITLKQVDFVEALTHMLDVSLHHNKDYLHEITKLQADNKVLTEGNEMVLEQLENLQREKIMMENVMYRQFLNLLNSKKEEIIKLRSKLGMEVDEEDTDCEEEMDLQHIKDDKSDEIYDVDTDVDELRDAPKDEPPISVEPIPSGEYNHGSIKKEFDIKDFLNSNKEGSKESGTSNVQNVLDAMSFLDPTVPFVP